MDQVLDYLATWPSLALVGVLGGIAALISGTIVRRVVAKDDKSTRATIIRTMILVPPVVIAAQFGRHWADSLEARGAVNDLAQYPLYAAIFERDPSAKPELRAALEASARPGADEEEANGFARAITEVTNRNLVASLPLASPASVHALFESEAAVMDALADDPEACLAYHQGGAIGVKPTLDQAMIDEINDSKAAVISSAARSPVAATPAGAGSAPDIVARTYERLGYPVEEAELLGDLGSLSAAQGCLVATHFAHVLAALSLEEVPIVVASSTAPPTQ